MRAADRLANSFFAKLNQLRMKRYWFDVPYARPFDSAAFFFCELNALLLCFAMHCSQNLASRSR